MRISTDKVEMILAEKQMSKTALSESSGISRQTISTIIQRGTCKPITAGRIAAGLGVTVETILPQGGTGT